MALAQDLGQALGGMLPGVGEVSEGVAKRMARADHGGHIPVGGLTASLLAAYKSADQTITNSTTLTADTALSVNLLAVPYYFRFVLFVTSASATAGFKCGPAGTLTLGTMMAQVFIYDDTTNTLAGLARLSALGGSVGAGLGAGDNFVVIEGAISPSAAGTLRVDWAQNLADAVNGTKVQAGSSLYAVRLT